MTHFPAQLLAVCAALLVATLVMAQNAENTARTEFEVTRAATVDHQLLVLPTRSVEGSTSVDGWRLSTAASDGMRVYRAERGDRLHTKHVAISSRSRIAFNPDTSRFERLAQVLRIELNDPSALDAVVKAAGGTNGKAYPLLDFAFVYLPADVDPVQAANAIRAMPAVANVRLTIKGPRREPR